MSKTMLTVFRVDGIVGRVREKKIVTLDDDFAAVMGIKRRLKISNKEFEKGLIGEVCTAEDGLSYRFEFDDDYLRRLHTDALLQKYGDRLERKEIAEEFETTKDAIDTVLKRAFQKLKAAGLFDQLAELLSEIYDSRSKLSIDIDMEVEYYE